VSMPRYAASVDSNQQEIIDALEKIGCSVVVIGRPVDLLCGLGKRNFLIEVKRPGAYTDKRQKAQREFLENWPGQVRVVQSAEEAIRLVTHAYKRR